jgi:Leucine-rich repeat (LRR) protein
MGDFAALQTLSLAQNNLSSSIPSSFGAMRNLTYLDLYANRISGSIPASLAQLTHLIHL